eukprot:SAG31_NODE_5105_length_2741_cov_1.134746_3_plen_111_part_00
MIPHATVDFCQECPRFDDLGLGQDQAEALAEAYAKLHASFWENEEAIGKECFRKNQPDTDVRNVEDIVDGLIDRGQVSWKIVVSVRSGSEPASPCIAEFLYTCRLHLMYR